MVMQMIMGACTLPETLSIEQKESVLKLQRLLNSKKIVHGDLRRPNILAFTDGSIRVVDFDCAGSEGSAYYPTDINMSPQCQWHEDVKPGGKIEMIHDKWLLSLLLGSL